MLLQQLEKYFTEYRSENSFESYLAAYTEKNGYPPYGVFIGDINGDGQDEMVLHVNPFGNLDILYMKNGIVTVVNCEVMSQWGNTWYDSGKNRIINMYFYGHTEGTAGAYEYYVYEWNGEDYVITMHLEQEAGYYEREADGVTKTDNFIHGQSYLNGEEISTERFEELHAELLNSMIPENRFDIIPSGAFETDEVLKKEQEEQYNAYLAEKLYSPQMTCSEQERTFSDAKTLPAKPQGLRIAKIELYENGTDTALDKTTESIALDCLRSSESYSKTAEALKSSCGRYYIDEVELTARTDENYQPEITVVQSCSLDLDGNGKEEHFVILRYLDISPEFIPYETDCCVFVSDNGEAELLIEKAVFLKMGVIKGDGVQHICFEAGCNNTTSFFSIYSLKNGKPYKELEEWKALAISDGEIKLTTQLNEYYAAYDLDKDMYVLYSLRNETPEQKAEELSGEVLECIDSGTTQLALIKHSDTYDYWCFSDGKARLVLSSVISGDVSSVVYTENGISFLVLFENIVGGAMPASVVTLHNGEPLILSEYNGEASPRLWWCPYGEMICKRGNGVSAGSVNVIPYHWDKDSNDFIPYKLTEITKDELRKLDIQSVVPDIAGKTDLYMLIMPRFIKQIW